MCADFTEHVVCQTITISLPRPRGLQRIEWPAPRCRPISRPRIAAI
jgi:hypothetical protein